MPLPTTHEPPADAAPVERIVRWLVRVTRDYGGVPLLLVVFGGAAALFCWAVSSLAAVSQEWLGTISDPTERGLAYVALAVLIHALFGSSKKVEVEVKCDRK